MTKCNEDGTYQKELVTKFDVIDFVKEDHLEIMNGWWGGYYFEEAIPEQYIPKHGCVILYKGKPVASCFLFINDTKLCHMDFCIVDPDLGAGRRVFFLQHVIDAGIAKAKKILGEDVVIWSLTDHAVVGRSYTKKGFECLGEGDCFAYTENKDNIEFLK